MGIFFFFYFKNSASSRLLAKISVSQVFWDPIENSVSPRSALLEAAYLEALLYSRHLLRRLSVQLSFTFSSILYLDVRMIKERRRRKSMNVNFSSYNIVFPFYSTLQF